MKRILILASILCLSACGRVITAQSYAPSLSSATLASQNRLTLQAPSQESIIYSSFTTPATEDNQTSQTLNLKVSENSKETRLTESTNKKMSSPLPNSSETQLKQPELQPKPNYPKAIPFTLENHTGKKISVNFPASQPMVLAIADKDGSEQMEAWIDPIYKLFGNKIAIHGIAELSVVPFFARGIAKGIIASQVKDYPVILDWEGKISKAYKFKPKVTNLYIISPQGDIVYSLSGGFQNAGLAEIEKALNSLTSPT